MRAALLVASLGLLISTSAFSQTDVPTLMGRAQRAYIAHDDDTAKELFDQVLQVEPNNTLAIQYLRSIRARQAGVATPASGATADTLIVSKLQFKDASFSSALDFLRQDAEKHNVSVSFVSQLTQVQMDHTVTLNLSSIPFLEALRYLCQLNNATYKVERYAIVILPVVPGSSPASQ